MKINSVKIPERQQVLNWVLWAAFLLAMSASVGHVAWAFGELEFEGSRWAGWLAAIAVDAGLAAIAYSIQQRKRAKRPTWPLWIGVAIFSLISAFANLLHALAARSGAVTVATFSAVDPLVLFQAVALSASLPVLVLYLGEIVSSDDAQAALDIAQRATDERIKAASELAKAEAEARAEQARLDRERIKAEREAAQAAIVAEQKRLEQEREALRYASVTEFACLHIGCGRSFATQNALVAHARIHKNGHAVEIASLAQEAQGVTK